MMILIAIFSLLLFLFSLIDFVVFMLAIERVVKGTVTWEEWESNGTRFTRCIPGSGIRLYVKYRNR